MPTITEKRIQRSADALERIIKQAKRKLFEIETLANVREIQKGNFFEFKTPKDLFQNLGKGKE